MKKEYINIISNFLAIRKKDPDQNGQKTADISQQKIYEWLTNTWNMLGITGYQRNANETPKEILLCPLKRLNMKRMANPSADEDVE